MAGVAWPTLAASEKPIRFKPRVAPAACFIEEAQRACSLYAEFLFARRLAAHLLSLRN